MDRFDLIFTFDYQSKPKRECVSVYAFNFGEALEKGIEKFRAKYTRLSSVYKLVMLRDSNSYEFFSC